MTDQLYRIPPLRWKRPDIKHRPDLWHADALDVTYVVWNRQRRRGKWAWQVGADSRYDFPTPQAAKSAADAHYREQMERGLVRVEP